MSQRLSVHLLPHLFSSDEITGGVAVVIDVLRATTTITCALSEGAKAILPCLDIETAQHLAANSTNEKIFLGGERQGKKIEGFDFDNSPSSYTEKKVAGKTIAFTTTNGTKALHAALSAEDILIGAFVNLDAIISFLENEERPIHLICAGTNGNITAEDVLFAGAVVCGLVSQNKKDYQLNDSATLAASAVQEPLQNDQLLLDALRKSHGGQNLIQLGFDADIALAATRNTYPIIPQYDKKSSRITI
ncbi:hypothetical protein MNBD_PLANCTO02-2545 [hydrothermal vent metagenome]|uniref:2-phosphosulfolactate phosphatase n=1 Tax=hydrothermal vent metagenome TaxID=652676 RepID=A0A3B1E2H5_9ZZZZ